MLEIIFEKLFNRFDYDIVLNPAGMTILTGPNGYGKSTILKSIKALSDELGGIIFFIELDFEKIIVRFKGNGEYIFEKKNKELWINGVAINIDNLQKRYEDCLIRRRFRTKVDEDLWYDRNQDIYFNTNDILRNSFVKDLRSSDVDNNTKDNIRKMLRELRILHDKIGEVNFIREQRLIKLNENRRNGSEVINIITKLPDQFMELMRDVQSEYSTVANNLDSTYPNRLFDTEEGITEQEFDKNMKNVTEKFASLNKYNLSTIQEPINISFKEEHAKALKIYFEDFEKKFDVYKDFINKLDIYTDIINQRLSFKSIKISDKFGINIIDDYGKILDLDQLSSGEKQEIVLFYELIFGSQKQNVLLIDEPEISLHIAWQKKFINDLLRIISYKGFNVIVATHSPQIISNHWDNQIDLGELYGAQFNQSEPF